MVEVAAVVTASYGGRDKPWPQVDQDAPVEWYCFTDNPALRAPKPWKIVIDPPEFEHPNLAAKVHKMAPKLPHRYVIWIDANMEVHDQRFVGEAVGAIKGGIAVWKHPRRDCIYTEAEASLGAESQGDRYADLPIKDQMSSYILEGHPAHFGLYGCGTVAWDRSKSDGLGSAWLRECERWGYQDQLSLPVVLRRAGVEPGVFPWPQIARANRKPFYFVNRWLFIHPHSS